MDNLVVELKKTRERILAQSKTLNDIELSNLKRLRTELLKLIREIQGLIFPSSASISPEDMRFLKNFSLELDNIEIEVSSVIFAKEQEHALYTLWEAEVIPEIRPAGHPTPKFPALADFKVPNLFNLMDDSWLPKPRPDHVKPLKLGGAS